MEAAVSVQAAADAKRGTNTKTTDANTYKLKSDR
jgi:hypothetical protein